MCGQVARCTDRLPSFDSSVSTLTAKSTSFGSPLSNDLSNLTYSCVAFVSVHSPAACRIESMVQLYNIKCYYSCNGNRGGL